MPRSKPSPNRPRTPRLKMYTAYVDYPHLTYHDWGEYRAARSAMAIDRLAFPVVATSIGHAKKLAEKAWGDRSVEVRVMVSYIGPCVEPGGR